MGILKTFYRWIWGPPKVKTIDELAEQCQTIYDFVNYAKHHFKSKERQTDKKNWPSPQKAFDLLQAANNSDITDSVNCDDYAVVIQYVLKAIGYPTDLVYVSDGDKAHAFCSFFYDGETRMIDNLLSISKVYKTVGDMCRAIYTRPKFACYMEISKDGFVKGNRIKL